MDIKTIGVLGAGTMGNGIAQVAAMAGYNVIMRDIEDRFVEGGLKNINKLLSRSVEKGKMSADDKNAILGRIKGTTDMGAMKDADFVVEVIIENMDLKKRVFAELDELTKPGVILSSNTSSMSLTEIANSTKRPDKVLGMHFFNPVPIMRLVEVIRGYYTSDETVSITLDLAKKMGKETIEVKKDVAGFIVNRLMIPYVIEAVKLLEVGVGTKEDIDKAAKLGLNYPMGPFELMDLTGLDINNYVMDVCYNELNKESKWVAPQLLRTMVKAGRLGAKVGKGWYEPKK
jgi:3-hydroxybutyryl-CoA dehydrogenase